MRWLCSTSVLLMLATSGCAAYARHEFGHADKDKVRVDDTMLETLQKLGAPDFRQDAKDQSVMVWRHTVGISVAGCWESVKKSDLVVLFSNNQVTAVEMLPRGNAMAIFGSLALKVDELP